MKYQLREFKKLLADNSCYDRVFFSNSGAEANEGACKLARKGGREMLDGAYEIITANNSNLPINIPAINTHFVISDKSANVLVGPITFPNPGPTLARDVAAPDKEVKKSFPRKDRIKVIIM